MLADLAEQRRASAAAVRASCRSRSRTATGSRGDNRHSRGRARSCGAGARNRSAGRRAASGRSGRQSRPGWCCDRDRGPTGFASDPGPSGRNRQTRVVRTQASRDRSRRSSGDSRDRCRSCAHDPSRGRDRSSGLHRGCGCPSRSFCHARRDPARGRGSSPDRDPNRGRNGPRNSNHLPVPADVGLHGGGARLRRRRTTRRSRRRRARRIRDRHRGRHVREAVRDSRGGRRTIGSVHHAGHSACRNGHKPYFVLQRIAGRTRGNWSEKRTVPDCRS